MPIESANNTCKHTSWVSIHFNCCYPCLSFILSVRLFVLISLSVFLSNVSFIQSLSVFSLLVIHSVFISFCLSRFSFLNKLQYFLTIYLTLLATTIFIFCPYCLYVPSFRLCFSLSLFLSYFLSLFFLIWFIFS